MLTTFNITLGNNGTKTTTTNAGFIEGIQNILGKDEMYYFGTMLFVLIVLLVIGCCIGCRSCCCKACCGSSDIRVGLNAYQNRRLPMNIDTCQRHCVLPPLIQCCHHPRHCRINNELAPCYFRLNCPNCNNCQSHSCCNDDIDLEQNRHERTHSRCRPRFESTGTNTSNTGNIRVHFSENEPDNTMENRSNDENRPQNNTSCWNSRAGGYNVNQSSNYQEQYNRNEPSNSYTVSSGQNLRRNNRSTNASTNQNNTRKVNPTAPPAQLTRASFNTNQDQQNNEYDDW